MHSHVETASQRIGNNITFVLRFWGMANRIDGQFLFDASRTIAMLRLDWGRLRNAKRVLDNAAFKRRITPASRATGSMNILSHSPYLNQKSWNTQLNNTDFYSLLSKLLKIKLNTKKKIYSIYNFWPIAKIKFYEYEEEQTFLARTNEGNLKQLWKFFKAAGNLQKVAFKLLHKVHTLIIARVKRIRPTFADQTANICQLGTKCLSEEALTSVQGTHSRGPFETICTRGR